MSNGHKKVQVVVMSIDKEQLLLLEMKEDRGFGWQSVTGSVELDESWEAAAKRELHEETGLYAKEITLLQSTFTFHDRWNRDVVEKCFLALVEPTKEIKISSQEHQGYKWRLSNELTPADFKYQSNFTAFNEARNVA